MNTSATSTDTACESTRFSLEEDPHHGRNFGLGVVYMVLMRIGWIFKTESIIMPAVLDAIAGPAWMRGCLPMLNRFGQSIPPLMASDRVKNSAFKKYGLCSTTALMGICFLTYSAVWVFAGDEKSVWLPVVFLVIYGIFFALTGVNLLFLNTITGKLIRVTQRGMMSLVGTVIGALLAVVFAWFLLRIWLGDGVGNAESNFVAIFAFTGTLFLLAACTALFLKEPPDEETGQHKSLVELFGGAYRTIRDNRNFRLFAVIAALFGMSLILLPHYQRLARDRFGLSFSALIPWVIAQNLGAAFFSIPGGWLADRFGNRLVLRVMMFVLCLVPILALVISRNEEAGRVWFTVVFCLLGLTPVAIRYLNNYTLEVCGNVDHPRYLSTVNLAISLPPIMLSPLFGFFIDWISFEFVFGIIIATTILAWMLTFWIAEPRFEENQG